jgi:hypothetical protein
MGMPAGGVHAAGGTDAPEDGLPGSVVVGAEVPQASAADVTNASKGKERFKDRLPTREPASYHLGW